VVKRVDMKREDAKAGVRPIALTRVYRACFVVSAADFARRADLAPKTAAFVARPSQIRLEKKAN
jgi:hypothetical protein